ncbi:MAG: Calx-beta domain-containing protein [Halobacteriales archaeon]|nr:Calx-beta domain-containing protein [Halobacteriales archaeon]
MSVVVTEISVTPPNATLVGGDSLRFRTVVTDDRDGALSGVPVDWSVEDSSVVSIDAEGLVTALSTGTTTIRARFGGVTGEATVEVIPAPRIVVEPPTLAFYGGIGGEAIPSREVSITNGGGDRLRGLDFDIRYDQDEPTGWLEASLSSHIDPATLTATPVPAGLPPGQYSAEIRITSTTRRVTSVTVPVTLSLSDFRVVESDGSTVVTEGGTQDEYSVALGKKPSSDVVLTVTSGDTGEVTVSPGTLTFTPADWDVFQVVTVTGVDDLVDDGDVQTAVTVSVDDAESDDAFDPTPDFDVLVTTLDDDTADVVIAETDGGTLVTEGGGTDTLTVTLATEPAELVIIDVFSQDPGEVKVAPDQLSFDASNWSVPQVITVTGVDDFVIDGAVQVDVVVEVDTLATVGAYTAVPKQTISVTTADDDVGGMVLSRDSADVDETGTVDSVMVSLSVMPDSAVVLAVTNDDPTEVSVSPDTLLFQPSEWNVGRAIRFTGVDDQLSDGPQVATVTVSVVRDASDGDFSAALDATIAVTNADDDSPGFDLTETDGETRVSESGTTDDFQLVLTTQPRPDSVVVLDIVSPDPGEVTVSPSRLMFDQTDWNTPKTVTVTGVEDGEDDGDQVTPVQVSIGGATTDPDYTSVPDRTVSVTTLDTELVVLEVGGGTTVVTEVGGTDLIDVSLSHQPATEVVVSVESDDTGEVTVDNAQITFTPDNWSTAQTVTVRGVDDAVDDGDTLTDVRLTVVNGSSDPIFHDVVDTVRVTTTDDDGADIEVIELGGTVVLENGDTDEFGVRLTAQPAPGTQVVVDVESDDTDEVTVNRTQITFTPADWNTYQTVTVTGVPDNTVDGDQNTDVTISVNGVETTDPAYSSVGGRIVSVTTKDIDSAALTVDDAIATEGGDVVFSVTLSNAVEGGLSVDVTFTDGTAVAPDDYDASTVTLNFAGASGEVVQLVVPTVDETIVEGDETFSVNLDASHPSVTDVDTGTGTIIDDDVSSVTVNDASTVEGGDLAFDVTLGNPVQGGLTVDVTLSDVTATGGDDYDSVVGTLTFEGTAGEVEHFTVATIDDAIVEETETFTVNLDASNGSVDDADTGTGTINDNDAAGLTVNSVTETEGTGLTFTVRLGSAVQSGLTVDVTLTDMEATGGTQPLTSPEDYDNVVGQLTFAGTAGETEQFTVETLDDLIFEGTETFIVSLNASKGRVDDGDTGIGTIRDNDTEPTVTLSANPSSLEEDGSDSPSVVTATLSNPTVEDVTVSLGFGGTASAGDDYTRSTTEIVIPALSTTGELEINALPDEVDETDETVVVSISSVANGTENGTQTQTITLLDDDAAPTLSIDDVTVSEGDAASLDAVFTVTLSAASERTVTVDYETVDGTATAGSEYTATSGTLTFPAGTMQQTISVPFSDDSVDEPDQTFTVELTNPSNATIGDGSGTGTITDDDAP